MIRILLALKQFLASLVLWQRRRRILKLEQGIALLMARRRRLDYTSIGRKIFLVEQLPPGATPIYYKEPPDTDEV